MLKATIHLAAFSCKKGLLTACISKCTITFANYIVMCDSYYRYMLRIAFEKKQRKPFSEIHQIAQDLWWIETPTDEITLPAAFHLGLANPLPVDIIAIRSFEGIAGISLKTSRMWGWRLKTKSTKARAKNLLEKENDFLFSDGFVVFCPYKHDREWRIRPSTSYEFSTMLGEDTLVIVGNRSNQLDDGSALQLFVLSD